MKPLQSQMLLIVAFFFLTSALYAQESKLEFTKQGVFKDYKIVYFVLDHSATEVEFKEMHISMTNDSKIMEVYIEGNTFCKAKIELDVTPEYIQKYLNQSGFNFSDKSVTKQLPSVEVSEERVLPAHYPEKVKADGKEVDDASHRKSVEFWKKRYPQEWEQYQKDNKEN